MVQKKSARKTVLILFPLVFVLFFSLASAAAPIDEVNGSITIGSDSGNTSGDVGTGDDTFTITIEDGGGGGGGGHGGSFGGGGGSSSGITGLVNRTMDSVEKSISAGKGLIVDLPQNIWVSIEPGFAHRLQQVSDLLEEAKALRDSGDMSGAYAKLYEAQQLLLLLPNVSVENNTSEDIPLDVDDLSTETLLEVMGQTNPSLSGKLGEVLEKTRGVEDKIVVKQVVTVYNVTSGNETSRYTVVSNRLTNDAGMILLDVYVVLDIDKEVANSTDDIVFDGDVVVIRKDPLVAFSLARFEPGEVVLKYVLKTAASVSGQNSRVFLFSGEVVSEEPHRAVCGNLVLELGEECEQSAECPQGYSCQQCACVAIQQEGVEGEQTAEAGDILGGLKLPSEFPGWLLPLLGVLALAALLFFLRGPISGLARGKNMEGKGGRKETFFSREGVQEIPKEKEAEELGGVGESVSAEPEPGYEEPEVPRDAGDDLGGGISGL